MFLGRILHIAPTEPSVARELPDALQCRLHVLQMCQFRIDGDKEF